MDWRSFEEMCNKMKLKAVKRIPTPRGDILIADGFVKSDNEVTEPHFKTFWAINRNGVQVGRAIYTKPEGSKIKTRIEAAKIDAAMFLDKAGEVGLYAS